MWVPSSVSAPGIPVLADSPVSTSLPLCQTFTASGMSSLTETQVKPFSDPLVGFFSPAIVAFISDSQTTGPAMPSTSRPLRSSNDISAPSTSTFALPGVHSSFRPCGVFFQRGEKWPFGVSVVAAATWASGVFATSSPVHL